MHLSTSSAIILALAAVVKGATVIAKVSFPSVPPTDARTANPSFPGTSFELNTFQLYAQASATDASTNQYSVNLIKEIFKRTGARPLLRVGGTTGDNAVWNASLTNPITPAPGTSETGPLQIGPKFWGLCNLLSDTNTIWVPQLSFSDADMSHAIQAAQSIAANLGLFNIAAIEIGNEPNEYGGHKNQAATDVNYYTSRFQQLAANITSAARLPAGPMFTGPDLASSDHQSTDFTVQDVFNAKGFNSAGNIKYATDHWYRCLGTACALTDLMNHTTMISNTQSHIGPVAQFLSQSNGGSVKYFLDEINILSGTGNQQFSYSFATSLYGVDFMLYLLTLGVDMVNWEQVYGSNQNVWQPSSSSSMPAQTKNIYYWNVTSSTTRSTGSVEVDGLPSGLSSVTVKYLNNPGGAGQNSDHTTFGGSQWPFSNLGNELSGVQKDTVQVPVSGGTAIVAVPDSSIAIVYL